MQSSGHHLDVPIEVHQQVILARIRDFCDPPLSSMGNGEDPEYWPGLRAKLGEALDHVSRLKQAQLRNARDRFLQQLQEGQITEENVAEFKTVLDAYLGIGDYADIVFHLIPNQLKTPARRDNAVKAMANLKPASLLEEEKKPEEQRSSRSKKLTAEIYARLGFDVCEKVLARSGAGPERRRRSVVHRMRLKVAEYATVLHFPSSPEDTISPFLLTRIEAMIVCCLRLLSKLPA